MQPPRLSFSTLLVLVLLAGACTRPLPARTPLAGSPPPQTIAGQTTAPNPTGTPLEPSPAPATEPSGPSTGQPTTLPPALQPFPDPVQSLAYDPHDRRAAYALLNSGLLYRTIDRGESWKPLPIPTLPEGGPQVEPTGEMAHSDIIVSPYMPGLMWVRAWDDLYRSADHGQTWELLIENVSLWVVNYDGDGLYALQPGSQADKGGLYHSTDGGRTWDQVFEGDSIPVSPAAGQEAPAILSIAWPDALYAGTEAGIFRSFNGGTSWQAFNNGLDFTPGRVPRLAYSNTSQELYAIGETSGEGGNRGPFLARLTHGQIVPDEDRWEIAGGAELSQFTGSEASWFYGLYDLVLDPADPDRLYLATQAGVLLSEDAGGTWQPLAATPRQPVFRMAAAPGLETQLYLFTGGGLMTARLPGEMHTGQELAPTPSEEIALELAGQFGGGITAQLIQDEKAYLGVGPRLVILDMSTPDQPTILGKSEVLPGLVNEIQLAGGYAYLPAGKAGLLVLDVTDPAHLRLAEQIATPREAQILRLKGTAAYLVEGACQEDICEGGLSIFDLSDGAHPRQVNSLEMPGLVKDLALTGDAAYAVYDRGLQVIDLSDPFQPRDSGSLKLVNADRPIVISGSLAYVGGGALHVIDVSDPLRPVEAGFLEGYGGWYNEISIQEPYVQLTGSYCDVGTCFDQSLVANVSDPHNPVEVDPAGIPDFPEHLQPREDIGSLQPPGPVNDLAAVDGRVYVRGEGYTVLDVTDPDQPQTVQNPPAIQWAADTYAGVYAEGYAFVPEWSAGLSILDIRDPDQPRPAATFESDPAGGFTYNVFLDGDLLYLTTEGSLQVIDVSDPAQPKQVGEFRVDNPDNPIQMDEVLVSGGYAYLMTRHSAGDRQTGSLIVLDVSDPASPEPVSSVEIEKPHSTSRMRMFGDQIYLTMADCYYNTCTGGVAIVDIDDPAHPVLLSVFNLTGGAQDVALVDRYAFVAGAPNGSWAANLNGGPSGVWALNVADPARPSLAATYALPGFARSIAAVGKALYVAGEAGGLFVLRIMP